MRLGPRNRVHLRRNHIEQPGVVFSHSIQVEVRTPRYECEVFVRVQRLKNRVQPMRRAIQIKCVRRADVSSTAYAT